MSRFASLKNPLRLAQANGISAMVRPEYPIIASRPNAGLAQKDNSTTVAMMTCLSDAGMDPPHLFVITSRLHTIIDESPFIPHVRKNRTGDPRRQVRNRRR